MQASKNKTAKQYTGIHDAIGYSSLFSLHEMAVYYAVKSHLHTKKKEFWASKERIATIAKVSPKAVQRIFRQWREAGYLTVIHANRFKPVVYHFNEEMMIEAAILHQSVGRSGSPTSKMQVGQAVEEVGQAAHEVGQDSFVGGSGSPMNQTNINQPNQLKSIKPIKNNDTNKINEEFNHLTTAPIGAGCSAPPFNETVTDTDNTDMSLGKMYKQILEDQNTESHNNNNPPITLNKDGESDDILEIINEPLEVEEPDTLEIIHDVIDHFPTRALFGVSDQHITDVAHNWWVDIGIPLQRNGSSYDDVVAELSRVITANIKYKPKLVECS